jgi:L-alanine-DL-glutamate epimerase-like enolase superfamily enzyme
MKTMDYNRRNFLRAAAGASALSLVNPRFGSAADVDHDTLDAAAARPVLDRSPFRDPIFIESIELLRKGREYFVRVRSKDGAEGISVDNGRVEVLQPILQRLVIPYFIGKDAGELEDHLFGVYREKDNYKLQGLALWNCVALVEFAILDMLGRIANRPIGQLVGNVIRKSIPLYVASGRRDTTPEQEVEYLKSLIAQSGARAIKFRVGGRMSRNADASPGRTEKLIPLSRKALGDKIAIHADANSSYDPAHAIPVGHMLEDIGAAFFEEPCPFDDHAATKKVKDALKIPIALGEQESSQASFRSLIANHVADVIQPDLFYYGGLIRSIRVARMAELAGLPTTAHLSGGFGFVYMLHFASCTPKIGPWQEYKLGVESYGKWFDPPLKITDGAMNVPTAPGVGIADAKEVLKGVVAAK